MHWRKGSPEKTCSCRKTPFCDDLAREGYRKHTFIMATNQNGRSPQSRSSRSGGGAKSGQSKHSPKPGIKDRIFRFLGLKTEPETRTSSTRKKSGSRPDRKPQDTPVTSERLFVGNLSYSVSDQDLRELFKSVGKVDDAEIVTHRQSQRSKGFGFVTMASVDEAKKAASQLNGTAVKGREISVTGAKSEGKRKSSSPDRSSTSSPRSSSNRQSSKGGSERERRPRDRSEGGRRPRDRSEGERRPRERDSGRRSGKGRNQRDRKPSGSDVKVKPMDVAVVTTPNLEIRNLSGEFGEAELADLFAGVGEITNSEIREGQAKVEMASVEDAQQAVRVLHAKDFMGKTLEVLEATPAESPEATESDSESDSNEE